MSAPAGSPGLRYVERLWPSPGVCLITAALGGALGIVVAPIDDRLGIAVGAAAAAGLVVLLITMAAPVRVLDGEFRAGRARIPVALVGEVEVLDSAGMRAARGPVLDARAYLCLRGWLPQGVRVHLVDPDDPAPYWLVSRRHPVALRDALSAARA